LVYNIFMTEQSQETDKARIRPSTHGKLSSRYAMETALSFGPERSGPDPYVLDTVESSIEQVTNMMEHKGKRFDPGYGLTTFACANAIDERCIAAAYLPYKTRWIRDVFDKKPVKHYENLHFYDIHMDEEVWEFFDTIGTPHEVDIFDALVQSGKTESDTPKASLFIMKGIEFFEKGNVYSDTSGEKLKIFQENLPNFLNDTALVFIDADSPALKNVPGFTQIHTGNPEVEKESNLDIYLYQRSE